MQVTWVTRVGYITEAMSKEMYLLEFSAFKA